MRSILVLVAALGACGGDDDGRAADGDAGDLPLPTSRRLTVGSSAACTVDQGGQARCWGRNGNGELGDGLGPAVTMATTVLEGVMEIETGAQHSCARLLDGGITCRGYDLHGETAGEGLTGASDLAVGSNSACAVIGATVHCWGAGESDQAPDMVELDGTQVRALTQTAANGCALMEDATVQCWGHNELVFGDVADSTTPVPVPALAGASEVVRSHQDVCARLGAGRGVWCSPGGEVAGAAPSLRIASGGIAPSTCSIVDSPDHTLECWGDNTYGQLGDGTTMAHGTPQPVPGLTGVVDIGVGIGFACALLDTGGVVCWGQNGDGQLGDGTTMPHDDPRPVLGL